MSRFNSKDNESIINKAKQEGIKVYTCKDTKEALQRTRQICAKSTENKEKWTLRIMTNRTRVEIKNDVEVTNTKAGEEFIDQCLKIENLPPNTRFYVFHRDCPLREGESFARFFPEYLSHASDYFKDAVSYGTFWETYLLRTSSTTYLTYNPMNMKLEKLPTCNAQLHQFYVDEISRGVQFKLKSTPNIHLEIMEIRHIFNPILLSRHRDFYFNMFDKFNKDKKDGESLEYPQTLLTFHGTSAFNLTSFFETGFLESKLGQTDPGYFGKGYYLTTYPQYAVHYINIKTFDSPTDDNFKVMEIGCTRKVIGGYAIPGKKRKIEDLTEFGQVKDKNDGYDSHMGRVKKLYRDDRKLIDFFPILDESDEHADEIVLFDPRQFLPCFEITLKRIEPPKK